MGLDHSPVVVGGEIAVEPPTLRDNTGLSDRLARAVMKKWDLDHVEIPLSLMPNLGGLYIGGQNRLWTACRVEGRRGRLATVKTESPGGTFGLAVDMGSSTLVLALVDLEKPEVIETLTLPNPQMEFGADILTRAHFAEQPGGLERLVSVLRRAINQGVAEICRRRDLDPDMLVAGALAGNTSMTHFFLGLPVRTLIREPYVPVINRPPELTAGRVGLNIAPEAPIMILPNKGSYFGGDLMAGLVVAGMARTENPCLLVDVGTNAEVVLGQKDWLIGAAGAAGPALEGGVARMGMVAGPGAIDQVRIDRETQQVSCRTIDNNTPVGICGSGLIDLLAELFLSGLIDFRGRLTLPAGHPLRVETDEGPAFLVVPGDRTGNGEPILFTEIEIDILTRSKAAMYTILTTVLTSVGLTFDRIDRFFVAGTFGQYLDPRMAVAVGMVPDIPLNRYISLGNSSLTGTVLYLVSAEARSEVSDIWGRLTYLEMNVNQDLMNRFSAARFIPHTDRGLFPSVGRTIE